MIKQAGIVVAALFLLTAPGFAQDGPLSLSVAGGDAISKQTSGNGTTLAPTQNFVFVGSLRLRMARIAWLEANFGHTDNSQKFTTGTLDYRIQSTVTELSGAIVVTPFQKVRLKPFILAGGGVLVFNPNNTLIDGNQTPAGVRQTRPAILYGVGLDYPLLWKLALRLQYRGLFYQPPDFKVVGLFTGGRGHMAEPTVGLAFTF
jgi:opacity protein-like surface antigen